MKEKLKFSLPIALVILILDHITKAMIVEAIPLGDGFSVIPGIFDIVHGRNTGAAFGFLAGWDSPSKNIVFYLIGIAAVVFLYYYVRLVSFKDKLSHIALAFILGGALGNLIDRAWRGSVVDFLSFHYHDKIWSFEFMNFYVHIPLSWPAFNVADVAISSAVAILVWRSLKPFQEEGSDEVSS